jgi:hypothetical protein
MIEANCMEESHRRYLEDLESCIDPLQEEELLQEWIDFLKNCFEGTVFSPLRRSQSKMGIEWPRVSIYSSLESYDIVVLCQYVRCVDDLAAGNGLLLSVLCNYGTSILPLHFGAEPFVMDEERDTLPTSRQLYDLDPIKPTVDAGSPEVRNGYGSKFFGMAECFLDVSQLHPMIGEYAHIYHPVLQGTLDICEVMWDSSIFSAMYDCPDLVKALLQIMTEAYIALRRLSQVF